ncbi:hypothetical protein [Selenomonas ruminantium]|uniref:Uncharacterized protein n=1 Tax=Selenomonas ruminantium TaxID=971 RepID=A0A1I0YD29_SELRU|nr:hypothetical protein [Selenomonas ruminantium]SFB10420.1 hypothetical protein SAMN05216587_11165 [Selenomonas ruminantium]
MQMNDRLFKVFNVRVYGIREALIRAGYPMATVVNEDMTLDKRTVEDMLRIGKTLGHAPIGHGDDKFLRQIMVSFDLLAPRYFWAQFDTYGVFTTKNSQSTMHRGKALDYRRMSDGLVDDKILDRFLAIVEDYTENPTEENLLRVKANMPEGVCLGAGISTNYAQLRTIFYQRKNHRLPQWRWFCDEFIKGLPYAKELGVAAF